MIAEAKIIAGLEHPGIVPVHDVGDVRALFDYYYPGVLPGNVVSVPPTPLTVDEVKARIAAAEAELKGHGRLLIRKSGTEPVIRVMAEGDDEALVERLVDDICDAVAAA